MAAPVGNFFKSILGAPNSTKAQGSQIVLLRRKTGEILPRGSNVVPFLVMTYFLLRGFNILPKKELHWSPWVETILSRILAFMCSFGPSDITSGLAQGAVCGSVRASSCILSAPKLLLSRYFEP